MLLNYLLNYENTHRLQLPNSEHNCNGFDIFFKIFCIYMDSENIKINLSSNLEL